MPLLTVALTMPLSSVQERPLSVTVTGRRRILVRARAGAGWAAGNKGGQSQSKEGGRKKAEGAMQMHEGLQDYETARRRAKTQGIATLRQGMGEEAVADAADGGEVAGVGGVVLDVAAEADDEVVDGAGVGVFVDAPDVFEDLLAGDDLAVAVGEVAEEVGFHNGEVGGAVGGDEFEGGEVDGAAVEEVEVGGGFGEKKQIPPLRCGMKTKKIGRTARRCGEGGT